MSVVFPGIVSYGDDAQREAARMEREGIAPPVIDLEEMMRGDTNQSGSNQDPSADLLKNLQGDK